MVPVFLNISLSEKKVCESSTGVSFPQNFLETVKAKFYHLHIFLHKV